MRFNYLKYKKNCREPRKPNKEGLNAKAQYKAAVKICERLNGKSDLTKAEAERFAWTRHTLQKGREHFAATKWIMNSKEKRNLSLA